MYNSHHHNNTANLISLEESKLVARAIRCIENRLRHSSVHLQSSNTVRSYLKLNLADERSEVFAVLFLNNNNCLIAFEKLFFGTINEAMVYPRVVVQKALEHNAVTVIVAHNHISDRCEPSHADKELTRTLRNALDLVDIKLVDHIIVSQKDTYSFAENNLLF